MSEPTLTSEDLEAIREFALETIGNMEMAQDELASVIRRAKEHLAEIEEILMRSRETG